MAARSIKRVSKRFYKALNDVSTTDFFNYSTSHKDRPFLSSRKGSESAQGHLKLPNPLKREYRKLLVHLLLQFSSISKASAILALQPQWYYTSFSVKNLLIRSKMKTQQARQKSPGKYEWEPGKDVIIYSSSGSQNTEKGCSGNVNHNPVYRKQRTRFSWLQRYELEGAFNDYPFLTPSAIKRLEETGLPKRTIKLWFKNRRVKMRKEMRKWGFLKNKPGAGFLYDYFSQALDSSKSGNTWRPQSTMSTVMCNEPETISREQTSAHLSFHWPETLPDLNGDLAVYLFPEGEEIASKCTTSLMDRPGSTHSSAPTICSTARMSDGNFKMILDGESQMALQSVELEHHLNDLMEIITRDGFTPNTDL